MKIKFTKGQHGVYVKGQVIDPSPAVAKLYIERGVAVAIETEKKEWPQKKLFGKKR